MQHESGEEAKKTRPHEAGNTKGARKLTAPNYYDNMQQGWQIRSDRPNADTLLQTMAMLTAEKGEIIRATLRGVVTRMRDQSDDPAVFLVYRDWTCGLHPSLLKHRDVHVLASTFCCCIR